MTGKPKIVGATAKEKERYIHVYLTPALDTMLAQWKEATAQGYADTARQAIFEYLNPRLEKMAPRPAPERHSPGAVTIAAPNPRQCRSEIITAAAEILSPYIAATPNLQECKVSKVKLEALVEARREAFEVLGLDATMKNLFAVLSGDGGIDPRLLTQAIYINTWHDRSKAK